jgi:hypothetical protein
MGSQTLRQQGFAPFLSAIRRIDRIHVPLMKLQALGPAGHGARPMRIRIAEVGDKRIQECLAGGELLMER